MSGDMNTSLGNCLLMCALVHQYATERHIDCSLANNGDDCVVIMEERDVQRFMEGLTEWFLEFGFTMVVELPVTTFEHIEFCQMQPVKCVDGYVMVRNVYKSVMKDLTTILSVTTELQAKQWFWAIGSCGKSLTYGVPIFNALYTHMVNSGISSNLKESPWLSDTGFMRLDTTRTPVPITPEARVSFWLAFGITPDVQEAIENELKPVCSWAQGVSALAGLTYNILLRK